jgi:hypothetical protein
MAGLGYSETSTVDPRVNSRTKLIDSSFSNCINIKSSTVLMYFPSYYPIKLTLIQ